MSSSIFRSAGSLRIGSLPLCCAIAKLAGRLNQAAQNVLSLPSPIFLWEREGRGCKLRFPETHTLTLSLVRERASISSSLVNSHASDFQAASGLSILLVRERGRKR